MQTIPAAVETLLKSRKQVGANRPAYAVTIAGSPGGWDFPEPPPETIPSIIQGQGTTAINISNWVQRTSGGFICCWFDGTSKALQTGYSADLDFLDTDYAIESVSATAGITVDQVEGSQVALYRRTDGKVLALIGSSTTTCWVKCYISDSGDGDDWAYLSTIASYTTEYPDYSDAVINVPIKTATGRLLTSFKIGYPQYDYHFPNAFTAYSDDDGETWVLQAKARSAGYGLDQTYQVCQIPDGTLFYCEHTADAKNKIYKSVDNGANWSLAGELNSFNSGMGVAFCYDAATSTVYALGVYGGTYRLTDPNATDFMTFAKWTNIYPGWSNSAAIGRMYVVGGQFTFYNSDAKEIIGIAPLAYDLVVKSITIERSRGAAAAQATIVLDNTGGQYSPDSAGDWAGVIMPNTLITIKQGYGTDLVQTFVGYVDSVEMTNFPAELRISCRDKGKLALDRIVTNAVDGGHYVKFTSTTVEDAVTALAGLCGLTAGTIEATGMTLTSKLFSWESYADAIDWLADISSSSWRVDELGVLHFTRDVMPVSPTTAYAFAEGEDIISLGYMISDQDLYYTATVYGTKDYTGTVNTSSVTVTWVSGDKFDTAWTEDKVITIDGSTYRIDAVASDTSLTVKATIGTKTGVNYQLTDVIKASANFGAPLTYGLFSQKVLKIDAPDADTVAACQEIADRAVALMLCRCRVVDFAAVAVPWLQIGDFIQVTETTSTISELYRVTDISLNQDPSGFTMGITCYWYGEVPT